MSETENLESLAGKYPEVAALIAERDKYREQLKVVTPNFPPLGDIPPGHFYSPLPSLDEIRRNEGRLFENITRTLPGVDFRESAQLGLIEEFATRYYPEMPFTADKTEGLRFYFDNPMYSYGDAISLYSMIRHLKPRRIVEIGSGFSSAVILDTNERFFDSKIETTFIEPYNERLLSLLTEKDKATSSIVKMLAQDVNLNVFTELEANDILFIDSSHVGKIGSDVHRILFEILPSLKPGVHIHFHDIFLPLEYPASWVYAGVAWNEAYLLRSFLQYNSAFEVVMGNSLLGHFHGPFMNEQMPLFMRNPGAGFWLRRKQTDLAA